MPTWKGPLLGLLFILLSHLLSQSVLGQAAPPGAGSAELAVTYLANEGVYLSDGTRGVLIDALFTGGVQGYATLTPQLRRSLEEGTAPFDNVVVALTTHDHADHFDARSVARFLEHHPEAIFVSTPQAIERLRPKVAESMHPRIRALLPPEGNTRSLEVRGLEIRVLNLHHGRGGNPPTENLGFVFTLGGQRVLHIGDTEGRLGDFRPYALDNLGIDLGLLPYWFLLKEHFLEVTRELIQPKRAIALHMPTADAPRNYFDGADSVEALTTRIRDNWPGAEAGLRTGQLWTFSKGPRD